MDREQRIDLILDHYQNPRHRGRLDPVDISYAGENVACGDVVTVYLYAGHNGAITLSFDGEGCTISQAAASIVMELLQGRTWQEIEDASVQPLQDMLGPDIVTSRRNCALLAFNAVKQAVRQYRLQQETI